ncbi:MAG: C13 family peptidase [Caldilineaceae bacterium]
MSEQQHLLLHLWQRATASWLVLATVLALGGWVIMQDWLSILAIGSGDPTYDVVEVGPTPATLRSHAIPNAPNTNHDAKLTAGSAAWSYFGNAVALRGDLALVGASEDDSRADRAGAAFLFERNLEGADSWKRILKLTLTDAADYDHFGDAVAVEGDWVVVGAPEKTIDGYYTGAAYLFARHQGGANQWGLVKRLSPNSGGRNMGDAVAIRGDTIVVGASGAAYLYEREQGGVDNWGQSKELVAADGIWTDDFGVVVAIDGDLVVVGAPKHAANNVAGSGAVYLFDRNQGGINNWGLVKKLTAGDGAIDDHFGAAVSIQGDTIAVGASDRDDNGASSGAVYLFGRNQGGNNNWGQVKKVTANDAAAGDSFGLSVAIDGDLLTVGAPYDDDGGDATGSLYLFRRDQGGANQWGQVKKLAPTDPTAGDNFGVAVAIDNGRLLAGADNKSTIDNYYTGAAYLFAQDQGGANNWGQWQKVIADDLLTGDALGSSVAIGADIAVAGAPGDDEIDYITGAAYLFQRDSVSSTNWKQRKKMLAFDARFDDTFGHAVAISGDTLVIATYPIEEYGKAYVFERKKNNVEQWGFVKKLTVSGFGGDGDGTTVALDKDSIVLLSIAQDADGYISVGASVFARNLGGPDNWGESATLISTDVESRNRFSPVVAISGDLIAVGAYRNLDGGNATGSVYLFGRNQGGANKWGQIKRLTPFLADTGGSFGRAVTISGDLVAVGAPYEASSAGAVYLFGRDQDGASQWGLVKKIVAQDAVANDQFGAAVRLTGDALLVGAPDDDDKGDGSGSVYVYGRKRGGLNNWGQVAKITASDGTAGDNFGSALDSHQGQIIVGAPGDDDGGDGSGSAYLYSLDPTLICYTLTSSHSGSGNDPTATPDHTVSCPVGQYTPGETITVNANPGAGWEVAGWGGSTNNASKAASNTVLMPSGDHVVSVTYVQICYALTRSHSGAGNDPVATPPNSPGCAVGSYVAGAQITLQAAPATGYQVSGWQGSADDNSSATVNTLTMPVGTHTVSVTYVQGCYTLSLDHTGSGADPTVTPTRSTGCAEKQYHYAEAISLSANATIGWQISGWSGTASDSSTAATNSLTMPAADHTATVHYVQSCYGLTLSHSGAGADPTASTAQSTGCPAERYHYAAALTLTAQPASGWRVAGWSGTENNSSTALTNTVTIPNADQSVSVAYSEVPVEGPGDGYEADNSCSRQRAIAADGSETQEHTFHAVGDVDWVRFTAEAGVTYRIDVQIPDDSRADVNMEVYANCEDAAFADWKESFSPGARLDVQAPTSGQVYIRLSNQDADVSGANVRYELMVRALEGASTNRALILMAGRLKGADMLQRNIHNVTNAVYSLFQRNGYTDDNIYYLATDSSLAGHDKLATKENLRTAITRWAAGKLHTDGVLTLYLMDHGSPETFYIDELNSQRLSPVELDGWLSELEAKIPNLKINVIIEACQSGSFITKPGSISKAGRVIITSTNDQNDAKASQTGAYFSDHLVTWLHQGYNLSVAFGEASTVATTFFSLQRAMLDANGNGIPNEFADGTNAARRSFAYAGTLTSDDWPPYIFAVQGPTTIANFSGQIEADVRDNVGVRQVWAVVYPPDYTPPPTAEELQAEVLPTFLLTPIDDGTRYAGKYTGFTQSGTYRIIVQAEDGEGLKAKPVVLEVNTGAQLFLPWVVQ